LKKIIAILFILNFAAPSFAVTIGGPDLSVPEESMLLKEKAIKRTLDRLEYKADIRAGIDVEIITDRNLTSSPADDSNMELEGKSSMLRLSNNLHNVFEPYVKVGTSNFEVKWRQYGKDVEVETDYSFVWGAGIKATILEQKDYGIKLTLDTQYRNINLGFDDTRVDGSTAATQNETFEIKELQIGLLASKKFILPIGGSDFYIVPYTGATFSSLDVDVSFEDPVPGGPPYVLYSTYDATDENIFGIVLGCDIMPFSLSYYLLNFELRLINETAFSLGGTIKF